MRYLSLMRYLRFLRRLFWSITGQNRPATLRDRGKLLSKTLRSTRDAGLASRMLEIGRIQTPFRPLPLPYPSGKRLLVLAAEQGHELIGCGGLIQNALASGREVQTVYLGNGAPPGLSPDERRHFAERRDDQARHAWQTLGGNPPIFWDGSHGPAPDGDAAVGLIERTLEEFQPDCVFVPFFLDEAPSRRQVSEWLLLARLGRRFDQLEVWSYQVDAAICPQVAVDITEAEPRKNELLRLSVSQNGGPDYAHQTRGLNAANSQYVHGQTGGRSLYFEMFFVLPLAEYADLLGHYDDR